MTMAGRQVAMRCSHCGRPIPPRRLGVGLTHLQTRIFDAVEHAGEDGIPAAELFERVFADQSHRPKRTALKVQIWRLNEALANTGYRIENDRGPEDAYHLIQSGPVAPG